MCVWVQRRYADGSKDDLVAFLAKSHRFDALTSTEKESLEQFLLAFPTETAPIVGFSLTVTSLNVSVAATNTDLQLLISQVDLGNCDLVVTGFAENQQVRFVYNKANKNTNISKKTKNIIWKLNFGGYLKFGEI